MEKSPTPIPSPAQELDDELRDSHVRLKDVPTTEQEWDAVDADSTASEVDSPPLLNTSGARLQLVSITPKEPVPSVDPDPGAEIIPLRHPAGGLVAAERSHIADQSEAKFHKRNAIEQAVRTSKKSTTPPPTPNAPLLTTRTRRRPRGLIWLVAALFVFATLVVGAILSWSLWSAEPTPARPSNGPSPISSIQLDLRGVPSGATISVDGEQLQGTTIELPVDGQHHTLSIEADGYQPWTLTLNPSTNLEVPVQLTPNP